MKVQLERTFALPGSADTAWAVLQDIDAVASCMPGAKITERIDETHFKGTVSVKFGPASMAFRGEIEVLARDAPARTMHLLGKGTDSTGSSAASMDLTARIEAVDALSCQLLGSSEVSMSGKAAAFGGRMMDSVADQVLKQFAGNFAARVQALQAQAPVAAGAESPAAAGAASAGSSGADNGPASAPAAVAAPRHAPPAAETQLNAFALAWAVLRDWLRSLFGPRKA